jgi:hypothetical protein
MEGEIVMHPLSKLKINENGTIVKLVISKFLSFEKINNKLKIVAIRGRN